jgi:hypothetical protein
MAFSINAAYHSLTLNCGGGMSMYKNGSGEWEKLPGENIAGIPTSLYRWRYVIAPGAEIGPYDYYVTENGVCLKPFLDDNSDFTTTYVDFEAGDMNFMLNKIAVLLHPRIAGSIKMFDEMLPQDTYKGNQWKSDWYPAVFEGLIPKYTTNLTISDFTVHRYTRSNLSGFDQVGYIEAVGTGATYSDAMAYINQIKALHAPAEDDNIIINETSGIIGWKARKDNRPAGELPAGTTWNDYEWGIGFMNGHLTISFTLRNCIVL